MQHSLSEGVVDEDFGFEEAELEDEILEMSRHFLCQTVCVVWYIGVKLKYISLFNIFLFCVFCVFINF